MNTEEPDKKQPFFSHLKELRNRLLICIVAAAIAFVVTYGFKEQIFTFLAAPFVRVMPAGSRFIFTGITEGFMVYFKISLMAALFIVSPVILFHAWRFISPGLYENERRYIFPFVFWGSVCFLIGMAFAYFVVIPYLYKFFVGYASGFIVPMPDIKGYVTFTLKLLAIFGLLFEFPVLIYYLSRAGVVNYRMLSSKRRYAIVVIFLVTAMFAATDPASLVLVALPFWGLYEICILIAKLFGKNDKEILYESA